MDLTDLVGALVLLSLFLPILPWEGRKQGNYSLIENIHAFSEAGSRDFLDIEAISARYEKEIPNQGLRDCIVARNLVLTMLADTAVMMQEANSTPKSNVPFVFIFDSLINNILNSIALPDAGSALVDVAEKCQDYPNAYLTVEDVEVLKRKDLPRTGFWEYLSPIEFDQSK